MCQFELRSGDKALRWYIDDAVRDALEINHNKAMKVAADKRKEKGDRDPAYSKKKREKEIRLARQTAPRSVKTKMIDQTAKSSKA
jgi:hypothetical protein